MSLFPGVALLHSLGSLPSSLVRGAWLWYTGVLDVLSFLSHYKFVLGSDGLCTTKRTGPYGSLFSKFHASK